MSKTSKEALAVRRYSIKLNNKTDADIISKLGAVKNMQGYIKELIRADLKAGNDPKNQ